MKKLNFTNEEEEVIKQLVSNHTTLKDIKSELESRFNKNYSIPLISKHIKDMGIKKTRKRVITKNELIDLLTDQKMSIKQIADKYNTTSNLIEYYLNSYKISWKSINDMRLNKEWENKSIIDLRSLDDSIKSKLVECLSKTTDSKIEINKEVNINNKTFIVDFYFPETQHAYIYNGSNKEFLNDNPCSIVDQCRWSDQINKRCKQNKSIKFTSTDGKLQIELNSKINGEECSTIINIDKEPVAKTTKYNGFHITPFLFSWDNQLNEWKVKEKIEQISIDYANELSKSGIIRKYDIDDILIQDKSFDNFKKVVGLE